MRQNVFSNFRGGYFVLRLAFLLPCLAAALGELIADADLRGRLGAAGEARLRGHFSMDRGIDRLMAKFQTVSTAS